MISVVIPYYNSIKTIEQTLDSVLIQTFANFELIIIDDCSSEDPSHVIETYKQKFNNRQILLRYHRLDHNSGPSKARNIGWDLAEGNFIAFLDADDKWHPSKLEICWKVLNETNINMLIHDAEICTSKNSIRFNHVKFSPDDFTYRVMKKYEWFIRNQAVTPAVLVRKDLTLRFNEKMKYSEDYDLWIRIVFEDERIFKLIGSPLTYLGKPFMHGNGLSSNITQMRLGEIRVFANICVTHPLYLIFLPILLVFSILKHIKLVLNSANNIS